MTDIDTQIEDILVNYGRILQRVSPEHSLTKRTYRETHKAIKTLLIQSNIDRLAKVYEQGAKAPFETLDFIEQELFKLKEELEP